MLLYILYILMFGNACSIFLSSEPLFMNVLIYRKKNNLTEYFTHKVIICRSAARPVLPWVCEEKIMFLTCLRSEWGVQGQGKTLDELKGRGNLINNSKTMHWRVRHSYEEVFWGLCQPKCFFWGQHIFLICHDGNTMYLCCATSASSLTRHWA